MTTTKILSKELFARNRYALIQFQTRFGDIEWFVADAEVIAKDGLPEYVFQGSEAGARAFIKVEEDRVAAQDRLAEIEARTDEIVEALQTDRDNRALKDEMIRLLAEHESIIRTITRQ